MKTATQKFCALLLAFLLPVFLLAGCAPAAPSADDGRLKVIATTFPGYDFARAIGGDNIALKMLLLPGAETHSFEPTPQDVISIQNCDVFIYGGGDSDSWVDGILASMNIENMTIVKLMDIVEVVEEELVEGMTPEDHSDHDHDHDHDDDHDHGEAEYDEHVWTAPKNAKRIARAVCDTFCLLESADPAKVSAYQQALVQHLTALEELDAAFTQAVAAGQRKTLIFGDRFPFRYFVDAYGLDYFAAFPGCAADTEPSAETVAFLIDKVRAENIPVVFYIELSNERMADTIAEETGAKKLLLHACHNISRSDFQSGATYLSIMQQNLEHLREALGEALA